MPKPTEPPTEPYRHAIQGDASDITLCGIDAEMEPETDIACDCGPDCDLPTTCPTCKAVLEAAQTKH